jgi:hypothetical protein
VLLLAWCTVWLTEPLLPLWLLSPAYVTVTVSAPAGNTVVVQLATPGLPESVEGEQPVFALQVSVPIGCGVTARPVSSFLRRLLISPFSPVTVAVKVTDCP